MSGVRRAKSMEDLGRDRISADVYDIDGSWIESKEILLRDLLSPKSDLDLTDARDLIRYRRLQSFILAGVILHPIKVMVDTNGTPLSQVKVLT